ncbi:hypothetical protein MYL53_16030 [Halomonas sp. YJPS3-2]|nr:hypothetical protein [Halomonas getboli]MCK2185507.1 hypothetical protein [Halomonas getboli]
MTQQILRKLAIAGFIGMTALGLAACEDEGPAEQAGENIDEAVDQAGESVEEMGDSVEDAADEADSNY